MTRLLALVCLLALSACALSASPEMRDTPEARGREIARTNCSVCHAIGRTGASPAPEAPPFHTLSINYPIFMLEEALAEGISVGHPAMPEFRFEPDDVDALTAYLQSIQSDRTR
jgi:cytochrome c